MNSHPNDAEAHYFLGAAYGLRAAYEASAQRRFFAALRDSVRSLKLQQDVLRLDPAFNDAYLTLGTYHYAIGCVPLAFRAIATMAGIRGGKKKGIAELEIAKTKGVYNRDDAKAVPGARAERREGDTAVRHDRGWIEVVGRAVAVDRAARGARDHRSEPGRKRAPGKLIDQRVFEALERAATVACFA